MASMKLRLSISSLLAIVVLLPLQFMVAQPADAACGAGTILGRAQCRGYFTNQATGSPVGNVLSSGFPNTVNSATEFNNYIRALLYGGGTNAIGAAFIIETMIGQSGAAFTNSTQGIAAAKVDYPAWSARILDYEAAGRIVWFAHYALPAGYQSSAQSSAGNDEVFRGLNAAETPLKGIIEFRNSAGGVLYRLNRDCANPIGTLNTVTAISASLNVTANALPVSGVAGTTFTFTNRVGTSATLNTGTNSFDAVTSNTAAPATRVLPAPILSYPNRSLDPNRPLAVDSVYTFATTAATAPGIYCRTITVSGYPAYVNFIGSGLRVAYDCVTVTPPPLSSTINCTLTASPNPATAPAATTLSGTITTGGPAQVITGTTFNVDGAWLAPTSGNLTLAPKYVAAFSVGSHSAYMRVTGSKTPGFVDCPVITYTVTGAPFTAAPTITLLDTQFLTLPNGTTVQYVSDNTLIRVNYIVTNVGATPNLQRTVAADTTGGAAASGFATDYAAPLISYLSSTSQGALPPYPTTITGTEGQHVCFTHKLSPTSGAGGSATSGVDSFGVPACVYVFAKSGPTVATANSDVHAGAKSCKVGSAIPAGVTGISTNTGSYGQYVVTTSGSNIGGFVSNAGGADSAKSSSYMTVCRPDLWTEVQTRPATLWDSVASPILDVTGKSGVYKTTGNISITGTVGGKITIISPGTVTVIGNIAVSGFGVFTRALLPSLGVIAAGDININGGVTSVDAYLFSNSLINTCTGASVATLASCGSTLTVNGFLMASKIKLNRTGIATYGTGTNSPGEIFNMTGQIYVNPPAGFDLPGSFNYLQLLGERPPLN